MRQGACSFGLWKVAVDYDDMVVHRVRFMRTAPDGPVPIEFTRFLAGKGTGFAPLTSAALGGDGTYAEIYRAVSRIPYGETQSYGEIAKAAETHPRVVGNAMARNPTPLIVPCHRVISSDGSLGGFSPDLEIKKSLLQLEKSSLRRHIS
ncbi:methylated-DNA--protein-cysteine methyltransferase [Methanocorpusculum labreanum Z]|uniref:Methylated-DNA--protein-cysteine methyltransferase n=1 Tax=Methanocorpusculum labreanum (strain ATCC 43576 / DSM 4855 / Z) TaxID=410358 RepID=A2SSG6_METLZ|nr:methylated-DNA--[protein]-cysteine S-methyltransferase [Methanocorpusculum labreanum]ABN07272.1 methylated-DNA--protein-cysteine methyltransferase [Methanocorpusculum labreanum Z]